MKRSLVFGLIAAPIIVALGSASGLLSGSGYGNPWFDGIAKPWFMPPGWVFPIAWTTLYALMGFALGDVLAAPPSAARRTALGLFALQLLLNLAWSSIFFGAHRVGLALATIFAIDIVVIATILAFRRVRPCAALLLIPYPCWLVLATALNWSILRLNG
ncbi:TspO/MBR family protein [Sphingomonas sp. MMS24-J13]|uniref:TspO/MBR family protein n=1 Tax=Sphingomonas sp. MMS24-J13 TaxID=3238686 RepID=UPI00384F02E4